MIKKILATALVGLSGIATVGTAANNASIVTEKFAPANVQLQEDMLGTPATTIVVTSVLIARAAFPEDIGELSDSAFDYN